MRLYRSARARSDALRHPAKSFWNPAPGIQPGIKRMIGSDSTKYLPGVNAWSPSITFSIVVMNGSFLSLTSNPYKIFTTVPANVLEAQSASAGNGTNATHYRICCINAVGSRSSLRTNMCANARCVARCWEVAAGVKCCQNARRCRLHNSPYSIPDTLNDCPALKKANHKY